MYFPLNENVSPVCAGLPAKPFHTHSYLIFTLALRGCRADYPHFIERETQAQREVTCPRSQSYEVPEWTCQHSSTSSSYLSAARAEASLVLGEGRSPHAGPSQSSAVSIGRRWWEMMSRPGPNTFPLNTSQTQGRPPLSPFLKPGLASLETEHPPVLSEIWWVWRFRREGSAVPWGLAKSLMLPVTLPGSIKRNTRQGRMRWLQAVQSPGSGYLHQ